MANPILQVENLSKSFGDLLLFENVSFGMTEGQHVGLIGKNGCGKSTLLGLLAGIDSADDGKITFRKDVKVDYTCFEIEDYFVVGYGLDCSRSLISLSWMSLPTIWIWRSSNGWRNT